MDAHQKNQTEEEQRIAQAIGDFFHERMIREQQEKVKNFHILNRNVIKGAVLFTGSSLMEQFPVCEIAASAGITKTIYNRSIGGTTTDFFLREIDAMLLELEPAKVFLNIGTNDISEGNYGLGWMKRLEENYDQILAETRKRLPDAEIYCMAYYPANLHLPGQDEQTLAAFGTRTPENLRACNELVKKLAEKHGCHYLDANAGLYDENGEQKAEYSKDGVHMFADAYQVVFENLKQYI